MREHKIKKERKCKHCSEKFLMTADEIYEHAKQCKFTKEMMELMAQQAP